MMSEFSALSGEAEKKKKRAHKQKGEVIRSSERIADSTRTSMMRDFSLLQERLRKRR
jgi:hypothetical protein